MIKKGVIMFSIIELQTSSGSTAHIYQTAETKEQAMSKYHTCLAAAAISNVEYHTCFVVDERGQYLARECYEHPKASDSLEGGEE